MNKLVATVECVLWVVVAADKTIMHQWSGKQCPGDGPYHRRNLVISRCDGKQYESDRSHNQ